MKKIKLLFVHSSSGLGGSEANSLQLLVRLDPRQFETALFCLPGDGPFPQRACEAGVTVLEFGAEGVPRSMCSAFFALHRVLRRKRFDLVYVFGLRANLLARVLRCFSPVPALVAAQRGMEPLRRPWYQRLAERVTASLVDKYVANSEAARSVLRQVFSIPEHKLVVIRNGLPRMDSPLSPSRPLDRRPGQALAISVANLFPYKGHQYLLQATKRVAARHPELRLLLVGKDCSRGAIPAMVRAQGLEDSVELLGFREDVPSLLAQCDFKVLASTEESMSTAVMEAMSLAKPVVVTDVGGMREVVEHGRTGLVVPPRDPQALAEAMIWMIEHPQEAKNLGEASRRRIQEEFTVEAMVDGHEALFTSLAQQLGTSAEDMAVPSGSAATPSRPRQGRNCETVTGRPDRGGNESA